ncbi:hypothetical protein [Brevibacillus sp. HB2.2]|uniref:hypothetical protein n=1 Tax=Brevibacillus sp. HB2.2 TaxID=2738846 RepID=UPI00156BC34A|nr:hypothetical protein [Brevibacillus sp. HB2.2]NRS51947.1 hypothetical protein [Brevibacillus sp. HB2.2]
MAKFEISCAKCSEVLPITFTNIIERTSLQCFNCQEEIPEKLLSSYKGVAENYLAAQENSTVIGDRNMFRGVWGLRIVE